MSAASAWRTLAVAFASCPAATPTAARSAPIRSQIIRKCDFSKKAWSFSLFNINNEKNGFNFFGIHVS